MDGRFDDYEDCPFGVAPPRRLRLPVLALDAAVQRLDTHARLLAPGLPEPPPAGPRRGPVDDLLDEVLRVDYG